MPQDAAINEVFMFGGGLFDRYVEMHELGAGGMARVVLAHDRLLDRRVALKLLRTREPELMLRLLNEARLTARCRHDNIVDIFEIGYQNNCPYIVLEYLLGKPLSVLLESTPRLPYPRAVAILVPVLQALQHIHELDVVHRDLKPDNIFVLESGTSKLLDFGIAKSLTQVSISGDVAPSGGLTRAGMLVGTYEYMSPEQWHGAEIDHLTDIWACGILLYQMICGVHPLHPRAGMQLIVTAMLDAPTPPMWEAAPANVPRELSAIVDRCLLKPKALRWQSANELLAALMPFLIHHAPGGALIRHSEALTLIVENAASPRIPLATQPNEHVADASKTHHEHLSSFDDVGGATAETPHVVHARKALASSPRMPTSSTEQPTSASALVGRAQPEPRKNSILFLAAAPSEINKSMHDRQAREIQTELERSAWRNNFELVTQWASESLDLLRELRKKPVVVHFAGIDKEATDRRWGPALVGDRKNGLYLRGADGRPRLVTPTALEQTFGAAGKSVKVVVMSSCYWEMQAAALLQHIDCVLGMPACHPDAAKAYAIGFYGALGEGEPVATAHQQGCAAVALVGHGTEQFRLQARAGVDASKLVLPTDGFAKLEVAGSNPTDSSH